MFGGITVLWATPSIETCDSGDAATLMGKTFPAIWKCHWQYQEHSLLPSKSLSPIGKDLLLEQHSLYAGKSDPQK